MTTAKKKLAKTVKNQSL